MGKSVLITGGARSGKSTFALEFALRSPQPVLFVATATPGDEEMRKRIDEHRRSRPPAWRTLEATTGIGGQISSQLNGARTVVVDCITLLVNNIFSKFYSENTNADLLAGEVMNEIRGLTDCIRRSDAHFIIVTNEVGLGIVPADRLSRLYRDLLGKANQALAQQADEVYLMVSGMPLRVKPNGLPGML